MKSLLLFVALILGGCLIYPTPEDQSRSQSGVTVALDVNGKPQIGFIGDHEGWFTVKLRLTINNPHQVKPIFVTFVEPDGTTVEVDNCFISMESQDGVTAFVNPTRVGLEVNQNVSLRFPVADAGVKRKTVDGTLSLQFRGPTAPAKFKMEISSGVASQAISLKAEQRYDPYKP